ncbi:bifunctional 2-polyprenyl-6-hydroxyphenol methylase/3-demethylubiquinol 3-O-methyltransferase UbiG [Sediminibacterium sp.]|uniref:class I SAM-dependent methyltransferase n=1 Tax=Sediminibacterium sp. TaxID=1917865 RepID=UPI0027247A58|nr:methyltransferase domain-containing protein [Sediminibacterium sp.]MDO8998053.1 methyltransferase domain-containing protein [Sediminibacterium sp.]MDP2422644.1 methyltransferase domain-containing protein [Sediminibacterium sp.]
MQKTNLKWVVAQKLEYLWWIRYLKKKNPTEYLIKKIGYWKKMLGAIEDVVVIQPGAAVLDAGCGPAGIFIALNNNKVEAIDPLLDKYQNLPVFKPAHFGWTHFRNIPIEALDDKEKYDIIFCLNAINHVNDINICCKNLVDSLKPNGFLVMSTDAHRHPLLKKIFQLLPGDMLHPIQLDINEYADFLEKNQMKLVKKILYKRESIFDYYILIAQK